MKFINLSGKPVAGLLLLWFSGISAASSADLPATLTLNIPAAPLRALTGSQFAAHVAAMDSRQREQAIREELLDGNVPRFLRNLVPVQIRYQPPAGKTITATVFVMPEYLAIGSDEDFLRIPMNLYTASAVASRMGFILPTRKIVDAIYRQAAFHFSPEPMTPGPQMGSTEYYKVHNEKIQMQARSLGVMLGDLVSGHKKDVVLTNLLASNPGRIAIYGWHRPTGIAIQPLSTVHGACYADYSHGIRLVSETVLVDGQPRSVYDVLQDPVAARALSDEGPIPNIRELMTQAARQTCGQT